MPSASKKTPLKKPPRSSPRCHPKEKAVDDVLRSEIYDVTYGLEQVSRKCGRARGYLPTGPPGPQRSL